MSIQNARLDPSLSQSHADLAHRAFEHGVLALTNADALRRLPVYATERRTTARQQLAKCLEHIIAANDGQLEYAAYASLPTGQLPPWRKTERHAHTQAALAALLLANQWERRVQRTFERIRREHPENADAHTRLGALLKKIIDDELSLAKVLGERLTSELAAADQAREARQRKIMIVDQLLAELNAVVWHRSQTYAVAVQIVRQSRDPTHQPR